MYIRLNYYYFHSVDLSVDKIPSIQVGVAEVVKVCYRPVVQAEKTVNIRLIPYYAWGNRGKGEMTVWMPLAR